MRLLILIMLSALLVQCVNATTVAQAAQSFAEPAETYTLSEFSAGGHKYWVMKIGSVETFVFNERAETLNTQKEIEDVLILNLYESSQVSEKNREIIEMLRRVNQSEYPARTECERTTGVDKMPCYDKESCIKACYAVPLCAMQIRDDLVYAILEWNTARQELDKQMIEAFILYESGLDTSQEYAEMEDELEDIDDALHKLEDSRIYDIPYCKNMSIDYGALDIAIDDAEALSQALASESAVRERAKRIYNNGQARLKYLETREATYRAVVGDVVDGYAKAESLYNNAMYVDDEINVKIAEIKNSSFEIKKLAEEGNYRQAIDKGKLLNASIDKLLFSIKAYSVQYDQLRSKRDQVLSQITQAEQKIDMGSEYGGRLKGLKSEVEQMLNGKIKREDMGNYSARLGEIEVEVKAVVADAVLAGAVAETEGNGLP
ncbi:MAG: hypothetical protein QXU54_00525, partial [Candidatus Micrarchaeia archaeon]